MSTQVKVESPPPLIHLANATPLEPQSHWFDWLDTARAHYGDVFTLEVTPEHRVTVLGHPALLDHVLKQHANRYPRVPVINAMLRRYLGDSFFTVDGADAQQERQQLQPGLMTERIHKQMGHTQRLIDSTLQALTRQASPSEHDLSDLTFRLTMTVALSSIFGLSYAHITPLLDDTQSAFRQVSQDYTYWASHWGDTPLWHPSKRHWQFLVARYKAYALMKQLTQWAIQDAQAKQPELDPSSMVTTWLSLMPANQHRGLLSKAWQDRLRSVFSASFESLSSALTWSIAQLDQHPEAQTRLIHEICPHDSHTLSSVEGIRSLPWTRACFEESLRLYPPIYCVPRLSTEPDTLSGMTIPSGTLLDCSIYLVQRHPDFWPDADAYRPERFMPDSPIAAARQAYMPFGHGQHHCMGNQLALLQGPLLLANLYRYFEIHLSTQISRQHCIPQMLIQPVRPMPVVLKPKS